MPNHGATVRCYDLGRLLADSRFSLPPPVRSSDSSGDKGDSPQGETKGTEKKQKKVKGPKGKAKAKEEEDGDGYFDEPRSPLNDANDDEDDEGNEDGMAGDRKPASRKSQAQETKKRPASRVIKAAMKKPSGRTRRELDFDTPLLEQEPGINEWMMNGWMDGMDEWMNEWMPTTCWMFLMFWGSATKFSLAGSQYCLQFQEEPKPFQHMIEGVNTGLDSLHEVGSEPNPPTPQWPGRIYRLLNKNYYIWPAK